MGQLCGGTEAIGSKPEQWVPPESNHIKQWDNHCSGASELFKKGEASVKYKEKIPLSIIEF